MPTLQLVLSQKFNITLPLTAMRKYFVKTPRLLKAAYRSCIWHINQHNNSVYLSFDDGPHPTITPFVLEELAKYNAKATFFCIGNNVTKYADVYKKIIDAGHSIGNHTQNHYNGFKVSNQQYLDDIRAAQQHIESNLFRPPYGRITPSQLKLLKQNMPQFKVIMWDILSGDFDADLSPEDCLKFTLRKLKPGSIVVFHDSGKAEKNLRYVLPRVLAHCASKRWQFKSL